MKTHLLVVAAAALLFAGAAHAQSGAELAKAKGCLNCHEMEKKKIGPGLKEIAAKHKDSKDSEGKLVAMLRDGKGHMKVSATEAEIRTLVQYTLSQK